MEKELEKRERELNAEKRKATAAANENALLRERLQALEAAGTGGVNPLPIPTPPPPLPTPPPVPLTQLPFDPAMLATDPNFLAALAAAFRNSGAGGGGAAQPFGGIVPGMSASWPATVVNVSSTQSETKRQNLYRVKRIFGLFEPGKFDLVWKPLNIDSAGDPASYNITSASS